MFKKHVFWRPQSWPQVTVIWHREPQNRLDLELLTSSEAGTSSDGLIIWCSFILGKIRFGDSGHSGCKKRNVQETRFLEASKLASSYGHTSMKQWNSIRRYLELLTSPHAQTSPDRIRITCSFIWKQIICGDSGRQISSHGPIEIVLVQNDAFSEVLKLVSS